MPARARSFTSRRVHALLLAVPLLSACSNDLDALFVRADAGDAGSAGTDAAAPWGKAGSILSLYADLGAEGACMECMAAKCSDAEAACLKDGKCAEQARCEARCRDPQCMMEDCPQYVVGTGLWFPNQAAGSDDGGASAFAPRLPWFSEQETPAACRRRACAAQCEVGRVLGCVGVFEWGRRSPGSTVPFTLLGFAAAPYPSGSRPASLSMRYCSGSFPRCDDDETVALEPLPLASLPDGVAAFGPTTLDVVVPGTTGFFELAASGYEPHLLFPLVGSTDETPLVFFFLTPPATWKAGFAALDAKDDPAYGFLMFNAYDCMLDTAPDMQFEVSPVQPNAIPWYDSPPRPGLDRTTSAGAGGVALVDERLLDVRAVQADTKQVIARRSAWARAGARTLVDLVPRSAADPP